MNPIFLISLITAPFLDHLRMALPDIILKQSALHISLNEQHCLFCLTIVKFDCLSLPFLVITWTCLSKIGQIWTKMMMTMIIIIITNNMITIDEQIILSHLLALSLQIWQNLETVFVFSWTRTEAPFNWLYQQDQIVRLNLDHNDDSGNVTQT